LFTPFPLRPSFPTFPSLERFARSVAEILFPQQFTGFHDLNTSAPDYRGSTSLLTNLRCYLVYDIPGSISVAFKSDVVLG